MQFARWLAAVCVACPPSVAEVASAPATVVSGDTADLRNVDGVLLLHGAPFSGVVATDDGTAVTDRTPYLDGLRHGDALGSYRSGTPAWHRYFRNGKRESTHRGWWPNGQLQFERRYRNDLQEGEQLAWYASGAKFEVRHYTDGREDGQQTVWAEDGRVVANYTFKDGRRFGIVGRFDCVNVRTK